jgi:hypothetical protein
MGKLSVSVRIPAIAQSHDFLIPPNLAVKEVMQLMVAILVSEYGVSSSLSDLVILDEADGKALKMECSFSQLGIADGAKLILF